MMICRETSIGWQFIFIWWQFIFIWWHFIMMNCHEMHIGCPIYITFVSTQVRVPPGARNFYRRKFISFLPFLLSLFVSVETSTLSSSTRTLPRDKEELLPLAEYQWCLSLWAFVFLEYPVFIWLLLLRVRLPPTGVEPGIAGSPSPGFYHWATATVGKLMKLRNFI